MIPLFLFSLSCKSAHTEKPYVAAISFNGNGSVWSATSDYNLRTSMLQKKNQRFHFLDPEEKAVPYEPEVLRLDAWRIETWYAHRGYFNAQVVGWEVVSRPKRLWRRHPEVEITGYVEEGEQTLIRSIQWKGTSKNVLRRELNQQLYFSVGQPVTLDSLQYSEDAVRTLLHNRTYAHAEVEIYAEAWPQNCYQLKKGMGACLRGQVAAKCSTTRSEQCKNAMSELNQCSSDECLQQTVERYPTFVQKGNDFIVDIIIEVDEGDGCSFGEVSFDSTFQIPMDVLLEQVPFDTGDAYKAQKVSKFQQRLFSLNQFSVVTVTPQLDHEGTIIPVNVYVSERKPRQMQVGGGGTVESGLVSVQGAVDFSHNNLANQLIRMQLSNVVGYSFFPTYPDAFDSQDITASIDEVVGFGGPTFHSNLQLDYPRFLNPSLSVGLEIDYELGVEPTFRFSSPTISPFFGLKKPLSRSSVFRSLDARFSYYFTNFTYLQLLVSPEQLQNTQLGLNVDEQFTLAYLSQEFVLDGRNDPVLPKQGMYVEWGVDFAGLFLGGDYDYWRLDYDIRYFFPLFKIENWKPFGSEKTLRRMRMDKGKSPLALDSVFAFRTASGALLPYQRNAPAGFAPYANHLFLGGSNDVRGWRNYALGPSLCREPGCMVDGVQTTTDTIPLGGLASFYSSVEYRHYFSDVGFATFLDAGMVWDRVSSVRPSDIQPSVGIGGRYLSPIGPARLDFAYRLRDTPQFAAERKWNVHFALSETF